MPSWLQALSTILGFLLVFISGLLLSRHYITKRLVFSRDINDAVNYFGSAMAPPTLGRSVRHAEAMRKFNELVNLRRQRVDKVDQSLPGVLWAVVAIGGLLTITASYFFWIEDTRFHVALLSMLTTFVALMIYLIAALDRPFHGNISVSSDSYQLVIDRIMNPIDSARKNP